MSTALNTRGTDSPKVYRDTAFTNVVIGATGSPADLMGWNIINNDTAAVYVKFFDVASSGTVTLGTTLPVKVLMVPAQTTVYMEYKKDQSQYYFASGIAAASVAGLADSNTTAPATATYIEIYYKTS
jgi:hypothetical protein